MKFQLVAFLLVVYASSIDSNQIAWRSQQPKTDKAKPLTCWMRELIQPLLRYQFPVNISCNTTTGDVIDPLNGAVKSFAVGTKCSYQYTCPLYIGRRQRMDTLMCDDTAQWNGKFPDCSHHYKLAASIVKVIESGITFDEENEQESNEEDMMGEADEEMGSQDNPELLSGSILKKTEGARVNNVYKIDEFCNATQICEKFTKVPECVAKVKRANKRRFSKSVRNFMTSLCRHCIKKFCSYDLVSLL